jgi:hypothetical protein
MRDFQTVGIMSRIGFFLLPGMDEQLSIGWPIENGLHDSPSPVHTKQFIPFIAGSGVKAQRGDGEVLTEENGT